MILRFPTRYRISLRRNHSLLFHVHPIHLTGGGLESEHNRIMEKTEETVEAGAMEVELKDRQTPSN